MGFWPVRNINKWLYKISPKSAFNMCIFNKDFSQRLQNQSIAFSCSCKFLFAFAGNELGGE